MANVERFMFTDCEAVTDAGPVQIKAGMAEIFRSIDATVAASPPFRGLSKSLRAISNIPEISFRHILQFFSSFLKVFVLKIIYFSIGYQQFLI